MRGPAMAVCTMFNWGFNFLVSYTFLSLIGVATKAGYVQSAHDGESD